jgi:hypothetical protein
VEADDETGGYELVKHLLELGHRRITFLLFESGPDQPRTGYRGPLGRRLAGASRPLMEYDLNLDSAGINRVEALCTRAGGYGVTQELMTEPEPPTAIIAFSDIMAVGVLDALQSMGIQLPEQVSVAGYDDQLAAVLERTGVRSFHLDQYGWPKFAMRSDGQRVDLAAAFTDLLAAVRARLPLTSFMFNNVNDFPTYATARAPQNATYIEVWPPHSTLEDLGRLATTARSYRPERPPILAAYISCYARDEHRANVCATLVMAAVFSHGGTHLLLGEDSNVLTDPHYPHNHRISPDSLGLFAAWYDFHVRYGDLLLDQTQVDVTESFTGGINKDLVLSGPDSVVFSTQAWPGTVWTRVVRTSLGLVVHLINLVGQDGLCPARSGYAEAAPAEDGQLHAMITRPPP